MLSAGWTGVAATCVAASTLLVARPSGLPGPVLTPRPRRRGDTGVMVTGVVGTGLVVIGVVVIGVVGTAVVVVLGLTVGPAAVGPMVRGTAPVGALVLAAGAAFGWWLVTRRRSREQALTRAARVLEACELLAAELAAGLPPGRALARAAAAEPLLGRAAAAERLGADVVAALRDTAGRPGAAGLARLAAAWELAETIGQPLAPAVRSAAATLRRQLATDRVVAAELASARATARLLALLPVLALVLGGTSGTWGFLLGSPAGIACLAVGVGLGAVGLAWIERIADDVGTSRGRAP